MDAYEVTEKYFTTKEGLKDTLERYGVAVIPSVIDEKKRESIYNEMWSFIENLTSKWDLPVTRGNKDSWREFFKLCPLHSMLLQHFGIGQAQFAWNARQDERIIDIFATLWECSQKDLLVSFDGSSLHLPPETTNRGWHRKTWFHSDQSYTKHKFECVQSFLSLLDIEQGDGTLAVLEGSHKLHGKVQRKFNLNDKTDWHKLNDEQVDYYKTLGCTERRITCPKGSLVFWDSRTIHCGVEPVKERPRPNTRAVVYLCYKPRPRPIDTKAMTKKRKAFEDGRTTSHWPEKAKLFGKTPRTYGAKIPPITPTEPPKLTPIGKRLAGF